LGSDGGFADGFWRFLFRIRGLDLPMVAGRFVLVLVLVLMLMSVSFFYFYVVPFAAADPTRQGRAQRSLVRLVRFGLVVSGAQSKFKRLGLVRGLALAFPLSTWHGFPKGSPCRCGILFPTRHFLQHIRSEPPPPSPP
jgi:hypothetical protein